MEQIKTLDIVKERVKFVRQSTQHVVALRPISIEFLENGFVVRYVIQQNRIIHIVFDCREMPTEDKINEMQPYLSIETLDNVHVVTPNDDKKSIQVWLWKDITHKILTKEEIDKEVLNDGKSEKNNIQNKSRRNKTIEHCCDKKDCINYNSYAEPCEKCNANYANRKPVIAEDSEFNSSTCKSVPKEQ